MVVLHITKQQEYYTLYMFHYVESVYFRLVYTKSADSVFRALRLVTQSVNVLHYSLIHLQFFRASDTKLA